MNYRSANVDAVVVDSIPGNVELLIGYDYFRETLSRLTLNVDSEGRPQTLLGALGSSATSFSTSVTFRLPSCDVTEERIGTRIASVVLDAPDCWARRELVLPNNTGDDETYKWVVGWKWKQQPKLPRLLDSLTDNEYDDLVTELKDWESRGWLVKVGEDEIHKVRAVLPVVPVLTPHRTTKARPTLNFQKINSLSVKVADPAASSCPDSLRVWRRFQKGLVIDISKAYPSLHLSEPLTWYQCLYLRLKGHRQSGVLYRLLRLGFGNSSAPRILKCVLDYTLGPDKSTDADMLLPLPSTSPTLPSFHSSSCRDESHESHLRDSVPEHYKYFDDILVPEDEKAPPEQVYQNVEVIRTILSKNQLLTKDPVVLDHARLLGLAIFRGEDGRLYWKRRVSLSDLLAFEQRLSQEPLDITARDISSWLGTLASHQPVLRWLRPSVAIGKRLLGRSIGSDYSRWNEAPAPNVLAYCIQLANQLRDRGDPARGPWQLPSSEEVVYCYVDCSDIAIGLTLANERGDVFLDFTALRAPDKESIRTSTHINCGELEACIKGIELLIKFGYTKATLCCDSTAATHWLQSLVDKQRIHVNGLYKLLVTRRLDILRSLLDQYRLHLTIVQVRSCDNLADTVTRVDFNINPYCAENDAHKLVAFVPRLGGERQAWWPSNSELRRAQGVDPLAELEKKDGLPVLPECLHKDVILKLHTSLVHAGEKAVTKVLKRVFYVPNLASSVHSALQGCQDERCLRERAKKTPLDTAAPRRLATFPWEMVAADVTYYLGQPILVTVDEYSRYATAQPIRSESGENIWTALCSIFTTSLLGWPVYLRCDRGTGFLSLRSRLRRRGVTLVATSGHRPTANACVERLNRTLKTKLMYLPSTLPLVDKLQQCLEAYNSTPHSATGEAPTERFLGRQLRTGAEQPVAVPPPEGEVPFNVGQQVWVLKPPHERRAGERFMPSNHRVVTSSTHASTLERVADPSVQLLNVANDRIISAHTEECPEIIDEDNGSDHSGDLTISSHSVSSASVRNDPVSDGVQPDPNRQAELRPEGAPEVHGSTRTLRHRHVPVRFIPGGNPRETSFDSDGYPKE